MKVLVSVRGFRPFRPRLQKFLRHRADCPKFMPPLLAPRPRPAPTINFGPPLFRNAFRVRLSNGATNHHRNDLDAERSAIIATCVLSPPPSLCSLVSRFNTTVEDESFHQLLIFNLDIIYTQRGTTNGSNCNAKCFRQVKIQNRSRLEKNLLNLVFKFCCKYILHLHKFTIKMIHPLFPNNICPCEFR